MITDVGEACTLPSMQSPRGATFLGWSTSPLQTKAPKYLAGQTITMSKNRKLYAVCFPTEQEPDLKEEQLGLPDAAKYSKVIFVGDSRTEQAQRAFYALFGEESPVFSQVSFVALSGSGLNWLKTTGYEKLKAEIGDDGSAERPVAVIFNHGVNDLNANGPNTGYVSTMLEVARELSEKNVKLFYMSVNPMNRADYEAFFTAHSKASYYKYEDRLLAFNQMIRSQICNGGSYQYLDCFSYLMKTGFSYDGGKKVNGVNYGESDGLHYTVATYKRIYAYCLQMVNQAG